MALNLAQLNWHDQLVFEQLKLVAKKNKDSEIQTALSAFQAFVEQPLANNAKSVEENKQLGERINYLRDIILKYHENDPGKGQLVRRAKAATRYYYDQLRKTHFKVERVRKIATFIIPGTSNKNLPAVLEKLHQLEAIPEKKQSPFTNVVKGLKRFFEKQPAVLKFLSGEIKKVESVNAEKATANVEQQNVVVLSLKSAPAVLELPEPSPMLVPVTSMVEPKHVIEEKDAIQETVDVLNEDKNESKNNVAENERQVEADVTFVPTLAPNYNDVNFFNQDTDINKHNDNETTLASEQDELTSERVPEPEFTPEPVIVLEEKEEFEEKLEKVTIKTDSFDFLPTFTPTPPESQLSLSEAVDFKSEFDPELTSVPVPNTAPVPTPKFAPSKPEELLDIESEETIARLLEDDANEAAFLKWQEENASYKEALKLHRNDLSDVGLASLADDPNYIRSLERAYDANGVLTENEVQAQLNQLDQEGHLQFSRQHDFRSHNMLSSLLNMGTFAQPVDKLRPDPQQSPENILSEGLYNSTISVR